MKNSYQDHLYALILAGGGGTRLWPKSLSKTPKQFLRLFKGQSLMQITSQRFNHMLPWERIFCVTVSEDYKKEILREVPQFIPKNIIVEPYRRDTAPAHGMGALYISKVDPEAVIVTEAADRLVSPLEKYLLTLKAAAEVAFEKRLLVSMGVKPRYPHTGLGHIKKGKKEVVVNNKVFFKVDKFVEKPPLELAKKYTESGDYFWNAGQFVWRADEILNAISEHAPEIYRGLQEICEVIGKDNEEKILDRVYKKMPLISIDYAVAEKVDNMLVTCGDFFWTDIGDWKEVWENLPKDENGNVVIDGEEKGGEIINLDTSDALVQTDGRLIALVDVDNLIVVDTKEALLICSKSKAQNVKKVVERLKEKGREELL